MLYTRSLDSERTTFDFWSKPASTPCLHGVSEFATTRTVEENHHDRPAILQHEQYTTLRKERGSRREQEIGYMELTVDIALEAGHLNVRACVAKMVLMLLAVKGGVCRGLVSHVLARHTIQFLAITPLERWLLEKLYGGQNNAMVSQVRIPTPIQPTSGTIADLHDTTARLR